MRRLVYRTRFQLLLLVRRILRSLLLSSLVPAQEYTAEEY